MCIRDRLELAENRHQLYESRLAFLDNLDKLLAVQAQLRQEGVVEDARSGKNFFYTLSLAGDLHNVALKACEELPEAETDKKADVYKRQISAILRAGTPGQP